MTEINTKTRHDTNNSDQADKKQPKKTENVANMPNRGKIQYDITEVEDFFNVVFHTTTSDEHILAWAAASNTPSYPKPLTKTLTRLDSTKLAKACYFGTSTVTEKDDEKGNPQLYNRKETFKRLHVVVLDDIGTKVLEEDLPADLAPNYIIETSEGNFQWGFILETPIDDYPLAEALIHLVYTSGYSDEGGKMPTKVVRMPCGINGKKGDKGDFQVKLIELNTDYWTPKELLEVLDVGVSWDAVLEDVNAAKHGKSSRFAGTSLWSPIRPTAASLSGVIDPVLEWLYESEMVTNDNGNWVAIRCPWHSEHTDGNKEAGYSPIGRGGDSSNRRGFNCFHGHCADRTTSDFLKEVAILSGIHAPLIDNVADLVADYAYVANEDSAYRVRGVNRPTGMKIGAFKNLHSKKVAVYDHTGKEKLASESALWLSAPNRLAVQGIITDPASRERIVIHDGLKYLNNYAEPQWGSGSFEQPDVDMFKQFIDYLIPIEEERDYFMQWLAAKAQSPTFKGAAVLMVAPTQGTGRTTLTDMVTELFTSNNVKKVTFPQLCGATESGAFNDWMEAGIVTCDEIMSHTQNKHKVYETLKDLFDPRPKSMVINAKYGAQRSMVVYTSYLLLTNHIDAIGALGDDRRVYVIQNTLMPNPHEYFVKLNKWLSKGTWQRNVWRWLQTLPVDMEMLHAPAPSTAAKDSMIDATKSTADMMAVAVTEVFKHAIPNDVQQIVQEVFEFRLDNDADKLSHVVASLLRNRSQATGIRKMVAGKQKRFRITNDYLKANGIGSFAGDVKEIVESEIEPTINSFKDRFETDRQAVICEIADKLDDLML